MDIEHLPKYSYTCKYCKCKFTFVTQEIIRGYYGYTPFLNRERYTLECPNCHQNHYIVKENLNKYVAKENK